jgi:nitrite reductase/ring-hydroxylating ferredoxin subunit
MLYIGKNMSQIETPYYQTFQEGKQINVKYSAFLYVPTKLMAAAVYVDQREVLIQNNCPHMTLALDKWPAVNSNYVLEAVFTGDG